MDKIVLSNGAAYDVAYMGVVASDDVLDLTLETAAGVDAVTEDFGKCCRFVLRLVSESGETLNVYRKYNKLAEVGTFPGSGVVRVRLERVSDIEERLSILEEAVADIGAIIGGGM